MNLFVFLSMIYYYKSVKQNKKIDIDVFIDNLVERYISFINTFITNKCIFLGINPHVIIDIKHIYNVNFLEPNIDNPCGENNNQKYKFNDYLHIYNDSYKTRFDNNMTFNKKLQEECIKYNLNYISINDIVIDDNNNIKPEYVPAHIDHHLVKNNNLYRHLILKLNEFL